MFCPHVSKHGIIVCGVNEWFPGSSGTEFIIVPVDLIELLIRKYFWNRQKDRILPDRKD